MNKVMILRVVLLIFLLTSRTWAVPLGVFFDSHWVGNYTLESTEDNLLELEKRYMNMLNSQKPDLGLYFISAYEKDFENGDDKYWYGIEWRLFDEGYYQSKRERIKKVMETKLEFLQLKRDNFFRRIFLRREHVHFVNNFLLLEKAKEKKKLLEKILARRKRAFSAGYCTKIDVQRITTELRVVSDEIKLLQNTPREKLTKRERNFLNNLEKLKLRSFEDLYKEALKNSPTLKIQNIMISRADYFPSWKDDVDLRFFIVNRDEFYNKKRWSLGVKVAIPLYINRKRAKIIEIQKLLYTNQKKLIEQEIKRELFLRLGRFRKSIWELKRATEHYKLVLSELEDAKKKLKFPTQILETEPLRDVERLQLKLVDAKYQILSQRLKAYLYALEILEVYGREDLASLFQEPHF